jgi:hypothetical protein
MLAVAVCCQQKEATETVSNHPHLRHDDPAGNVPSLICMAGLASTRNPSTKSFGCFAYVGKNPGSYMVYSASGSESLSNR